MLPALTDNFCEFCMIGFRVPKAYNMHRQKCDEKRRARELTTHRVYRPGTRPTREFLLAQGVPEWHLNSLFPPTTP